MKGLFVLTLLLVVLFLKGQNPIVPPGMYIADPEAHVWDDGQIYIYGSRDESDEYWCSYKHHVLFSSDLKSWNVVEDAFASKGENDQVPDHDKLLFAPDCAYKDGTYYLYFCSPGKPKSEGVATSKSPVGPFVNGKIIEGAEGIDPAVLIDDDGQAYYWWGQGNANVAKMNPDMMTIDLSTKIQPLDKPGHKAFHEGSSIRNVGDKYYLVFADDSRENRPTCLGYAIADKPMGPYTYKGVIIDNIGSDPSVWNNHGSIEEFDGQWYVFYHRPTNNSRKFRKACIEPIHINRDGTIDEVEMTTQGALEPLPASDVMQAERACFLMGTVYIAMLNDADQLNEGLVNISDNDYVSYKYFNFAKEDNFRIKLYAKSEGEIELRIDSPKGELIGTCKYGESVNGYAIVGCDVNPVKGKHALYLVFKGSNQSISNVDWFQFY